MRFETMELPKACSVAPDGSEIRELLRVKGGSMAHCSLPPKAVSLAIHHRTVEELWYFIQGEGEVWRKHGDQTEIVKVKPGVCLSIPLESHFQFRNTGRGPLSFLIATIPPWPGEDEAVRVEGYWQVGSSNT